MFKSRVENYLRKIIAAPIIIILLLSGAMEAEAAAPPQFSPGEYVTFGRYWQASAETMEPIVWRVLAADESELFLLSDKILFFAPFDDVPSAYSFQQSGFEAGYGGEYSGCWRDSTIRAYLNGIDTSDPVLYPHIGKDYTGNSFKADAFTEEEWGLVKETTLVDEETKAETKDRGFLLGILEVLHFFPEQSDRWVLMTVFSKNQLPLASEEYCRSAYMRGYGPWFTGTCANPHLAAVIEASGWFQGTGGWVEESYGIRPALKLDWDAANGSALVKATNPPDPVPLFEEIVFSPGYNNFARGDTFTHDLVDLVDPPVRSRIMNGSTMVPVRYFCETVLQGTVAYEAETQKITAWVKGHEFVMHLNSPIMTIDGAEAELRQPPIVDEGYALAPLRAFESAVTSITWLPKTQQVSIIP